MFSIDAQAADALAVSVRSPGTPVRTARANAKRTERGGGSLGNPCDKFTAPCCIDSLVMSRITDSPMPESGLLTVRSSSGAGRSLDDEVLVILGQVGPNTVIRLRRGTRLGDGLRGTRLGDGLRAKWR